MANVINFLNELASSKGAILIGINNYKAEKSGEIADHVINVNISVMKAKETDLKLLQDCDNETLALISEDSAKLVKRHISLETLKESYFEMLDSAMKNLNPDLSKRTKQSQAQTDAYIQVTPAIKFHKESKTFHIFGQHMSKNVIVAGDYDEVNSSDKTLGKQAITKYLNLRAGKYRNFILANIEATKMNGEKFDINC